ncbi:MAG: hypothetical protein ACE5JD_16280 [Candidatus Methylomirabilia bacterium]
MVKTSLYLPEDLWKAAKHQALEEGVDLRDLIIRGLERLVKGSGKRGGKSPWV